MARRQIRLSRRMLITWFMLAGFIFLFAPQNLTNKFQFAFIRIFRWPLSISRSFLLSARAHQTLTDVVSRSEYDQLQNYLANVTEYLNQGRQKLEKLSGLRDRFVLEGAKFVLANVITAFINGSRSELIINRGEDDGLAKGQFVLGDNSIVGTISDVSSRTARVKLITDSASKMPVKIAGLNMSWLMQGSGYDSAKVRLIKHKVKIGNVVYADKRPGFLDTLMIVGKVAQCKRDDENPLLWDVTVKPSCDMEKLRDVVVIIMNPQQ